MMWSNQPLPGHFAMNPQNGLFVPPEFRAAPPECLTEQLFLVQKQKEEQQD